MQVNDTLALAAERSGGWNWLWISGVVALAIVAVIVWQMVKNNGADKVA